MRRANNENVENKEPRLVAVLVSARAQKQCTDAAIKRNKGQTFAEVRVAGTKVVFDLFPDTDCDVFLVHPPDCIEAPSDRTAAEIAERVNGVLDVARVVVNGRKLVIAAQQFILRDAVPSGTIVKRLIHEVLLAIVLVLNQLERRRNAANAVGQSTPGGDPALN